jgi:hypothetical protein
VTLGTIWNASADDTFDLHELVQRVLVLKRGLADAVAAAALAEIGFRVRLKRLVALISDRRADGKTEMYFVSSSWNPPLSCARATIGFENSIAAVAAKMVNGRQADHSTRTRIDAFGLLEDIPPGPARLDVGVSPNARALLAVKKK